MFEIRVLLMRWRRDDFAADTEDGRGVRGLDDAADGRWPMVMELFTKMEKLMLAAAMLPPAMPPLMLHLSARAVTVEHHKACNAMYCVNGSTVFLAVYYCNGQIVGSATVRCFVWITTFSSTFGTNVCTCC